MTASDTASRRTGRAPWHRATIMRLPIADRGDRGDAVPDCGAPGRPVKCQPVRSRQRRGPAPGTAHPVGRVSRADGRHRPSGATCPPASGHPRRRAAARPPGSSASSARRSGARGRRRRGPSSGDPSGRPTPIRPTATGTRSHSGTGRNHRLPPSTGNSIRRSISTQAIHPAGSRTADAATTTSVASDRHPERSPLAAHEEPGEADPRRDLRDDRERPHGGPPEPGDHGRGEDQVQLAEQDAHGDRAGGGGEGSRTARRARAGARRPGASRHPRTPATAASSAAR